MTIAPTTKRPSLVVLYLLDLLYILRSIAGVLAFVSLTGLTITGLTLWRAPELFSEIEMNQIRVTCRPVLWLCCVSTGVALLIPRRDILEICYPDLRKLNQERELRVYESEARTRAGHAP